MGSCLSSVAAGSGGGSDRILEQTDGGEIDYHERFLEDHVIGEGEFGQVKLVIDVHEERRLQQQQQLHQSSSAAVDQQTAQATPMACKILRKGMTFKDNTIYSPIKPEVLRGEVEILRALAGQHYCLKLVAVYESRRSIYIITEFCGGGDAFQYVAAQKEDLRTEDVSRIAHQLFSAVNHCATKGVMHRDIKPENIMFADPAPQSPMRLIDFGSGCIDSPAPPGKVRDGIGPSSAVVVGGVDEEDNESYLPVHTTFAGSAFYISPELFQRSYNLKTDVWSAGVTLYVLVAGYPADELQKAFNLLQKGKGRNLRKLPNLPDDLPDSFYDLLEGALTYRQKRRPMARQLLEYEFVQFHKALASQPDGADAPAAASLTLDEIASAAAAVSVTTMETASDSAAGAGQGGRPATATVSIRLKGSVQKHSIFLDFKNFERSLTTVLATMLTKGELERLVEILAERIASSIQNHDANVAKNDATAAASASSQSPQAVLTHQDTSLTIDGDAEATSNEQRLGVILVGELKSIVRDDLGSTVTIETMEKLPNERLYLSFAYHVTMLHEFLFVSGGGARSSFGRKRLKRTNSFSYGLKPGIRTLTGSNHSVRSASSLRGGIHHHRASVATGNPASAGGADAPHPVGDSLGAKKVPNSVHGSSVFAGLRPRQKTQSVPDFGVHRPLS